MNTLLFIYNAKSGTINTLFDIGHKLISPRSYKCNLCALTHNTFSETALWKDFRNESTVTMKFYHIDEFEKEFPNKKFEYPIILLQKENHVTEFVSTEHISNIKTIETLIALIKKKTLSTL